MRLERNLPRRLGMRLQPWLGRPRNLVLEYAIEHPKLSAKVHRSLEHTARMDCFDSSVRGGLPAQLLVPRWPDVRPLLSRLPGRRQRRQRHLRPYVQTPLSKKGPGELIDQ